MGYELQLLEKSQQWDRKQKELEEEIARVKWQTNANLKAKDFHLEASKKAQTIIQQRLKQAEETINEYLENPICDPTTETGKEIQIQKLKDDVKILENMNINLNEGFVVRLANKDKEINDL